MPRPPTRSAKPGARRALYDRGLAAAHAHMALTHLQPPTRSSGGGTGRPTRTVVRSGWLALLVVGALVFPALAQAPLDVRIALVIGNSAYAGDARLPNPVNDARDMAQTLKRLGFVVVEVRDASRAQMTAAIAQVRDTLKGKQAVGMLYYAGHGLQMDWRNYMVPVDARLGSASDVISQGVDVGAVIDAFKTAGNRMNILVLDACRDNPFGAVAAAKGLAPLDAPPGTFLAFATAPGNVAEDGDSASGNGVYTRFLLEELKKPAARIEDVFKRVRLQVRQKSQGRQVPWESTSLEDDFVFNAGVTIAPRPEAVDRERAFAEQKGEWDKIRDSADPGLFFDFLRKYPSGLISDLAQVRLDSLQKTRIVVQPDQNGLVHEAKIATLRAGDRFEFEFRDGLTGLLVSKGAAEFRQLGPDLFEGAGRGNPGTIVNQAGFVFKDMQGTYDPPWNVIPGGEFVVGNKSSARSIRTSPNGSQQWVDVESRIVAREKLTTALGTVDTYRIDVRFTLQAGGGARLSFWYEPGWGVAVRMRREQRDRDRVSIVVRDVVARSKQ